MGAYKRVDFSDRDKQILVYLYKHRYADFTALNIINPVSITLYKRLEKFIKFGYVKKIDSINIKIPVYAITGRGKHWLAQNMPVEFKKPVLSKIKTSSIYNFNHHLLIAKTGALLTSRNIDYEIDLTCKAQYPELKIIPDVVIKKDDGLIGFEIELEYKNVSKYAKKLSQLQTSRDIKKLIYLTSGNPETLKKKIMQIDRYEAGGTLEERLIRNQTKEKIEYIKFNEFIQDIDKYLS
ncbi:MAG: hypothetical protein M1478_04560 [Deltaproteobacteria bacterium]|jgi:hypothetical protein|nr:hypothetical protein [Deltaproteobacteria bacterium]MCL5880087.1 hypothetical protein [Deltaproteobacteria bacterium]